MGKFGGGLGIWELRVAGANIDLKPKMGDNRSFRKIMMNEKYKTDNAARMDAFEDWLCAIIERDNPSQGEEERTQLKEYVEFNSMPLFEEVMVKFRWTTRDELDKAKSEAQKEEQKKLIGGN